ncbi:MAG: hypothetical protein Kow0040_31900 [Thermogutta sp.]
MSQSWLLPERFRVRLTMESDWHVGSGMGRPGNVDRLITRDADDLPCVPGKTLHGIWRDACERLCLALDDGRPGKWTALVDRLFGSQPALGPNDPTGRHRDPTAAPVPAAVRIRPARIPSPLRERLIGADRRVRQALTFIKPGIKIDRRSGAAQTDMLRFEEIARKGTVLEADCRLEVDDSSSRETASALLIASAKLVERLGGKRRRGAGRCRLEILEADFEQAAAWLENCDQPPAWISSTRDDVGPAALSSHTAQPTDPWVRVPLDLRLQSPAAVSYRTKGNVVETLDFLPGTYLLPHITRVLSGLGLDARAAIQAGDVIALPAYPVVAGERGLPVPLALFVPKGSETALPDADIPDAVNRLRQAAPSGIQLKQMREGFIGPTTRQVYRPPITSRTHNTVEDQSQRPTEEVGGVYTYEAIAPLDAGKPVILRSELRLRKSWADLAARADAQWWERLSGDISLGRSRKDDYGSVRLEARPPEDGPTPRGNRERELYVWLVSDTLLRNDRLRPEPTAALLAEELSQRLGVTIEPRANSGADDRLHETVRLRRLESWHVGWHLPRSSLVALQAGSCMAFTVKGELDAAELDRLEASGIGERTAEGYGQLLFNPPILQEPRVPLTEAAANAGANSTAHDAPVDSGDPVFAFARMIERECWKQEIRRACLDLADSASKRRETLGWEAKGEQGRPPMSQLGGLRGQLALLRGVEDRRRVIDWLEHLESNPRRKDKWPSVSRVKALIETDHDIWRLIDTEGWPTLTKDGKDALMRELWPLAVRTFFDACIRAHKRQLESEQRSGIVHGS